MGVIAAATGASLATAGVVVFLRALEHVRRLNNLDERAAYALSLIELGALLACSLVLAGVAWWLVLRLRESHRQLQDLALRDPLTGLYNRRYFREVYAAEVQRARRTGIPFSVAMIDLDGFKRLNDTRGHTVGDAVLDSFAALLRAAMRSVDILARYGGDEFVVLMPMTNAEHAQAAMKRLERHLNRWQTLELPEGISVSTGVSTWDGHTEVLEQADMNMYEAKKDRTRPAGSPVPAQANGG